MTQLEARPARRATDLIFITGASRSGTTLLSLILDMHPAVLSLKETHYFGEAWHPDARGRRFDPREATEACAALLARQADRGLPRTVTSIQRSRARQLVDDLGPAALDPATMFSAVALELASAQSKSIACEKTPRNVFYAEALLRAYPSARIIHMVRDPRAVMASQKMRWHRRRLSAHGYAVSRHESVRTWVNYHPLTIARLWRDAATAALRVAGSPRVTLLRFEDLVCDPERTVAGLCDWLGLDFVPTMLDVPQTNSSHQSCCNGARRGLYPDAIVTWLTKLTTAEIAIVERRCSELMARFGYEPTLSPRSRPSAAEFAYVATYPVHLAGVLLINPRRAMVQGRALWGRRNHAAMPATSGVAID
jgi:hypothetical protein